MHKRLIANGFSAQGKKGKEKAVQKNINHVILPDMDLLNKVMMIGNLVRDPELRETGSGKAVTELTLALDPPGGGKAAEDPRQGSGGPSEAIFVDVVLWERNAENAAEYLKKGSPVLIEGRLRMDRWEDKDTRQTRTKLKVTGDRMRFLNLAPRPAETDGRADAKPARRRQPAGR